MKKRFRFGSYFSLLVQQRVAWALLVVLIIFYALWMSDQSILRYDVFKATAFDLGNMDQANWNTLHGHWFEFTNHSDNWYGAPIRLAQHVEPIFFLLALLYAFHADPRILLIFQTLMMAAGALPVFLLSRKYVPTLPLLAPVLAAGYLFAPSLIGQNIFDFHAVTLATPLFLYAFLFLEYRRFVCFFVACILISACKEELGAVVGIFGLLVMWKYRLPRLGATLFVLGMIWTAIAFLIVMPHFNTGAHSNNYWYRYAALGNTPLAAIINVLFHPWLLFGVFVTWDRVYYLFSLFRSTGFLALLAPVWLLPTVPSLAINLLSSEWYQHSGVYHYNAPIIPFIMLSSIHGLRRAVQIWYGWRGENEERELYRESMVMGYHQHSPGRPVPGWGYVQPILVSSAIRFWNWLCSFRRLTIVRRALALTGVVWGIISARGRQLRARLVDTAQVLPVPSLQWVVSVWVVGMIALNLVILTPALNIFWAQSRPGAREQHIEQLLEMIPPDASVSAGGNLNPHLTERRYVTVFPEITVSAYGEKNAKLVDYVIIDLDNASPENIDFSSDFLEVLNQIQRDGQYKPIAQAEGVLLLKREKP